MFFLGTVPTKVDDVLHHQPGSKLEEKFLPSILEDVEFHDISFLPTAFEQLTTVFFQRVLSEDMYVLRGCGYRPDFGQFP